MPHCGNYRAAGNRQADNFSIFHIIFNLSGFIEIDTSRVFNKIWIQNIHSIKEKLPVVYKIPMCK